LSNKIVDSIKDAIEEKLYFGPKGIIGIDIGLIAIKMCEVSGSPGKYKITNYVSIDLPEGTIIEDEIQNEDTLLEVLTNGFKELGSSNRFICLGLSGPNTILKRLQLAGGSEQDVEDQVIWEAEQYLPFPVDEGNVSYSIIGENQGGGVDVMVGAAKKSVVINFKEIIEKIANVKVKIVDHSAAAMINVLEATLGQEVMARGKTWIIMDLGAQKTNFIIYKNGVIVFFKEINIGGLTITEEIQRQMGVNYEEAESLKIQGDGSGNIPVEIEEIIRQVLDTFFGELKKTIDFWVSSTSEETFDGCIVTGGSVRITGFVEALQELLGADVQILNPFDAFDWNEKKISDEMKEEIVARGAVAIGLAMRTLPK
jgi:type IV pilus assembly protein PilM